MQRVLLGLLAVSKGQLISTDALVDGLWGEEWSKERERNLHSQISALRRRLAEADPGSGTSRLERVGGGYRLVLAEKELDVSLLRRFSTEGRDAVRAGDMVNAATAFGRALALWRGSALADAAPLCARLMAEAARLEELRAGLVEDRAECDLALGNHLEVATELAEFAALYPLRERLAGQLMVALWRCGRRGDALAVFDRTRRALAEELGLDPGPDLRRVQARVLADDPSLAGSAPDLDARMSGAVTALSASLEPEKVLSPVRVSGGHAIVIPRQLPAGAGYFADRASELKALDELLDLVGASTDPGAQMGLVMTGITGMAGVGKTALAVHWARSAASRFPDGQLFVNLRGYDSDAAPLTADEVIGWFLVALGIPAAAIPAGSHERAGLYRSVLATRRVLMLLDNVRDAAQVRPLLAGGPGCMAIVTSRSSLTGLSAAEGARLVPLAPMGEDEAVVLLGARLGAQRLAAEPAAVSQLVDRCGYLPLALAVMAARVAAAPDVTLSALAAQLAEASAAELAPAARGVGRLDTFETGDSATSLRELLSWSYRQLSGRAAEMFALLGVHCGPDISVAAAASLAGVSLADARWALMELAEVSLVAEHRPGRYVMHDLVSEYAAERSWQTLADARIRAAISRALHHYLQSAASSADSWFTPLAHTFPPSTAPPPAGVMPEQFQSRDQFLSWLESEHQVLLQAVRQAADLGFEAEAWQIYYYLTLILADKGYWGDMTAVGQVALGAARRQADHAGLARTLLNLGKQLDLLGAHDEAQAHHFEALGHFRDGDDLTGQANAHLTIAHSIELQTYVSITTSSDGGHRTRTGLDHAIEAVRKFRAGGENSGEGFALVCLGDYHAAMGDWETARQYLHQGLGLHERTGDLVGQGDAWGSLGVLHHNLRDYAQAIACFEQALKVFPDVLGVPWLRGLIFVQLGDAQQANGDAEAARVAWRQAERIFDSLQYPAVNAVRARLH
jgi:DNA-binding SARP family transcriptional activator/tetratricopeptide (TPR) repeat protein